MPVLRQGTGQTWLCHSNFVKSGRVEAATSARLFLAPVEIPICKSTFRPPDSLDSIVESGFQRSSWSRILRSGVNSFGHPPCPRRALARARIDIVDGGGTLDDLRRGRRGGAQRLLHRFGIDPSVAFALIFP